MSETVKIFKQLENIRYLFFKNYIELKKFQESYDEKFYLTVFTNNNNIILFQREQLRITYNFMTACSTLKEYMRKNLETMRLSSQFKIKYEDKVKNNFVKSELAQFFEACRNSFIHEGIPLGKSTLTFDSTKETKYTLYLDTKQLTTSDFWDKKGNAYALKNATIDLFEVCNEYYELIFNFHKWFDENIEFAIVEGKNE